MRPTSCAASPGAPHGHLPQCYRGIARACPGAPPARSPRAARVRTVRRLGMRGLMCRHCPACDTRRSCLLTQAVMRKEGMSHGPSEPSDVHSAGATQRRSGRPAWRANCSRCVNQYIGCGGAARSLHRGVGLKLTAKAERVLRSDRPVGGRAPWLFRIVCGVAELLPSQAQ